MTISTRFRTKTEGAGEPLFFIGCPSLARAVHFDRAMISVNQQRWTVNICPKVSRARIFES